jgi:hypothetical protein
LVITPVLGKHVAAIHITPNLENFASMSQRFLTVFGETFFAE